MKTEATEKPTVVTNVTPAPTKASPTHTPTTSLVKSPKVRARKLQVTSTSRLSTSKIASPVRTASPSIPTTQPIPMSQSKIPVPIVKAIKLVSAETLMFSEMPAFF